MLIHKCTFKKDFWPLTDLLVRIWTLNNFTNNQEECQNYLPRGFSLLLQVSFQTVVHKVVQNLFCLHYGVCVSVKI